MHEISHPIHRPAVQASRPRSFIVLSDQRRVLFNGRDTGLGGRAFDLLWALLERRGRLVSKQELQDIIWPHVAVTPNNLDVQLWALRRCIGQDAISTVARRGYLLTDAVKFTVRRSGTGGHRTPDLGLPAPHADELAVLAERLAGSLLAERELTLVGADPTLRRALCDAVCRACSQTGIVRIWRLQANGSTDLQALEKSIARLKRVGGLVVAKETAAPLRRQIRQWALAPHGSSPLLHLATAPEAAAGIDQNVFRVPTSIVVTASEGPFPDAPPRLRWRARTVARMP